MDVQNELMELGQLIIQSDIDALYIKDIKIEEQVNEHGKMKLRFLSVQRVSAENVLRYQGMDIQVLTMEGYPVFCGKCTSIQLICENEYSEVELTAKTFSIITDQEKKTKTFQGTGKNLSDVLSVGIGKKSDIQLDSDAVVSEMLSQEEETDWEFNRRIANQYQKQLFVNAKVGGCQIHVGKIPFEEKELGRIISHAVNRDVDKVRNIQNNVINGASVFEFEETVLTICDLTIGVGYAVTYAGRSQVVTHSQIISSQGTVVNKITLSNKEGLIPDAGQTMQTVKRSSILTGTVLEIEGNNVKVDFHSENDEPRWIPYANAVNNYFYCMPDEGDTVFVYYETGDSDKIVCLGSKHVNQSFDFERYQDKMLTANNRMIKFGEAELDIVGNRNEWDGEAWEQAKIVFNNEYGIDIQSTKDINFQTTDEGNIVFKAYHGEFQGRDTVEQEFWAKYNEGETRYNQDKGRANEDIDALKYLNDRTLGHLKDNVVQMVTSPFQLVDTFGELLGRAEDVFAPEESLAVGREEKEELITSGIIDMFALEQLILRVGDTCISFAGGIIQVRTDDFRELGTDRSITYEHLEDANYTWRDLILDVTQCALDIVGVLPIPGVAAVANFANAGISLARGDYAGAAMSACAGALSLFPCLNTVAGAGTAVKTASKLSKAMDTVKSVVKVVQTLATGANKLNVYLNASMSVWDIGAAIFSGEFDLNDPDCRQDLANLIQGVSTYAEDSIESKKKKNEDGTESWKTKSELETEKKLRNEARQEAMNRVKDKINNTKDKVQAKLDEYSANRCSNGEPIDMVTGSYLVAQCDFIINDITGLYAVERTYESLLAQEDSPVGRGWTLSLFSSARLYDDRVEVVLPDNHTETFLRTSDGLRNRRNGTRRITLTKQKEGYLLKEEQTGLSRFYDAEGRQITITDKNGNQTLYEYEGDTLRRILFASGQYLVLNWQGNKLISMEDCIGRKAVYHYEGELLSEVEMINGGVEKYAYDNENRLTEITDANGVTYVHNEYDHKSRVTRQILSTGQEYIILYNDDDRVNTYLVPANKKEIQYYYNKNRQLIRTEYQDGTTEEIRYDEWENRIWEKDRNGNEIHRIYDEYSHLLEEKKPNGLIESYEYDEAGNCIIMRDNTGLSSRYSYDDKGNLTKEVQQIAASVSREILYEYDKHGRVTSFTDPNGNRECYEYRHLFWQPEEFVSANGTVFRHEFDRAGRCVVTKSEDGTFRYAYNHFDFMCMATNPMNHTAKYTYDRVLDLVKVVLPEQNQNVTSDENGEQYVYDAFHNRICRVDAVGAVYAVLRDGEGNVVKEFNPNYYDSMQKNGVGVEHLFDEYDRNYRTQYPDGGVERRWYDAKGNLIKLCRPEQYDRKSDTGDGYSYEYDCMNRLIQITAPDKTVQKRYIYDLHGNVVKIISAKGMQTGSNDEERIGELRSYNYMGWLMEIRRPVVVDKENVQYQLLQYQYDKAGNRVKERRFCEYQSKTSASGIVHTISYEYDKEDRLIKVSDCTGAVLEYQYDSNSRKICEKRKINDRASRVLRYNYDAAGRMTELIQTADKEGCGKRTVSVKYAYDRNGNITKIQLPMGGEICREYDAVNRIVAETHLDKVGGIHNTTRFSYDKIGNLIEIMDNQGRVTRMEYDSMNRELKRIEKDGSVTRQFYNQNGEVIKVVRPMEYERAGEEGKGILYTYDEQGRVLTVIRADGIIQESNIYDEDGFLIERIDGSGSGATFQYDFGGRRIRVATKGQAIQQYSYDAMGNITGILDGMGNHTEYVLDKWGRIVEVKQADGSSEFYGYDYAGNIIRSTDGMGNTTTYEYNGVNKLSVLTDPEGHQETYVYDANEHLCRKKDRNGVETTYSYNLYGNLLMRKAGELSEYYEYTSEGLLNSAISQGMRYDYSYDVMNRLSEKRASGRSLLAFDYDRNGNLIHQTDVTGKETEFYYDLCDQLTEVWDGGKQTAAYEYNADGTVKSLHCGSLYTEYSYDVDKNLTGMKTVLGKDVLTDNHYRFDGNGNQIEKRQGNKVTSYVYDGMNRLSVVEYPQGKEELFYDRAGNRIRRIFDGVEELYRYDKRNRLTQYTKGGMVSTFEYDNAGNLLKDNRGRYEYDAFNRNTKMENFNGNIQINRYDAEGLRHEMEENGKVVSFIFRGRDVVTEGNGSETIRFIRTNILLASDAENAKTYYHYASDELGSITHIIDGEQEEILNRYEYDVWGNLTTCEEQVTNRFKYNGQQYDLLSQQYYLRARYYNPVIGRFTQEDSYRGDGLNLYAYCKNNPVYYVDPSGNICETAANDIIKKIGDNQASKNEQKKLASYLRNKMRSGILLNEAEVNALMQVDNLSFTKSQDVIQKFEVAGYQDFRDRSVVGDNLDGHEAWQHANLNENDYATTRLSTEDSKNNPVIALPHDIHLEVNREQRAFNARTQTPLENIGANASILYNNSRIPNIVVDELIIKTQQHYVNVTGKQ